MRPITVVSRASFAAPAAEIAAGMLELNNWPDFRGYGPIPGIERAEFERRTVEVVGTRIRVTNRDGSTHVEEIMAWQPEPKGGDSGIVRLRFGDFSPPLSRLARAIVETWEFTRGDSETHVVRSLAIYPRTYWAWPVLWLIARLLRRAIGRHLGELTVAASNGLGAAHGDAQS